MYVHVFLHTESSTSTVLCTATVHDIHDTRLHGLRRLHGLGYGTGTLLCTVRGTVLRVRVGQGELFSLVLGIRVIRVLGYDQVVVIDLVPIGERTGFWFSTPRFPRDRD